MASAGSTEKSRDIEKILNQLEADLAEPPPAHDGLLERLRSHITRPIGLGPLSTKRGISVLLRYAFDSASSTSNRSARRCLSNVLLLVPASRQHLADSEYVGHVVNAMKSEDLMDQLISARILFLCTFVTTFDFEALFEEHHISGIINTTLSRYSEFIGTGPSSSRHGPSSIMAACDEVLKLLYTLIAKHPSSEPLFSSSVTPVLKLFTSFSLASPPLQPPISSLINALSILPLPKQSDNASGFTDLFPESDSHIIVDRLDNILLSTIESSTPSDLDAQISPLIQSLLRIAEVAPANLKTHLQSQLLPSSEDREKVLGTGDSLPMRLLRLTNVPSAPHLMELIPALLFELSDKDPRKLVQNIGYGYAAGYLASQSIKLPEDALSSASDRSRITELPEGEDELEGDIPVNPITGQRLDREAKVEIPEMTDEEKEREAERLFVLFERLRATGVVDVENPVAQAAREGRLEEKA
ncbi:hypothetical protein M501DRAFT_989194 [Patellaria atrata CBS 101060]|uniref:Uncharacterized protein n=1 Tax=Patellaria atrata CBS 101060 TaxID=1346257 RepID=A0A9P4S3U8_9PEZI|nr:hypothetical protein M501DRAFT_989194 [Patellaria atrata CBS 101060]